MAAETPLIPIEASMDRAQLLSEVVGLHPLVHLLNKDKRSAA